MKSKLMKPVESGPDIRWSYYPLDKLKAQPTRPEDLPANIFHNLSCMREHPDLPEDLFFKPTSGRPPFFHAYSSKLATNVNRCHYLHISCLHADRPFLWLARSQYKRCRPNNRYFYRAELIPLSHGLAARWHRFTYLVSYDFTHVCVTAENDGEVMDLLTFLYPGEKKSRRFNFSTSGEIPIIASDFGNKKRDLGFL